MVYLLILFLLAAGGGKLMEIHRLETRVTKVEAAIQKEFFSVFPRRTPLVDALHQTRMELKNQQSHPATATGPLNVDLLTQISRALPSSMDIGFSQFTRTENQVKIMGNADQFSTVEKMKGQLAPLFKSVDILSAAMDKGSKRIKFNLSIGL
ncbi:MAG: PilN domain-containing protein [Desulfovibrionales bacterium]|nr:PilN domain-containing protein [Desulfovibrionales bacterium]